jgi:glyoxylase-like metal-dependent hydrolase (beta-lactamase superfamily II)
MSFGQRVFLLKIGERNAPAINHLYLDYEAPQYVNSVFYLWYLETPNGPILVDHGFDSETMARLGFSDVTVEADPRMLLARVGVNASDVKKVILTHLHFDHFCGETFFPNATYFVQKKEIEFVTGPLMRHEFLRRFVDPKAVESIVRMHFEGKVVILEGDSEIGPGIEVIHVGGHSPGSQAIAIDINNQVYVICGDVIPRYRNLEKKIPCGIHTDVVEALCAIEKIERKATSKDTILPGHTDSLMKKYPRFCEGVCLVAH